MSDIIAAPSVRALARNRGIDLDNLARDLGRTTIAREDLDGGRAGAGPVAPAAPGGGDTSYWAVDHGHYGAVSHEPISRFGQVASARLSAANALIPQVTHHDRADTTAIDALRRELAPEAGARGIKLTALAFYVKALTRALRDFPRFNASLSADGKTLILREYIHIGIAVDTAHGLMVPVLRDVDHKGLWQIATEIADLAARAQTRKVSADEMGGTSMTITNLGGIGGTGFTPIVNPPEVAILGLSRTETVTVWDGETPRPVPMLPLDLSYDHRVINGADAARFASHLAGLIADPRRIMV
jgi:pyruvate/2-oxoglutarate dehydrogenase complex dihydrolipoamide acyltransferase (E2) component